SRGGRRARPATRWARGWSWQDGIRARCQPTRGFRRAGGSARAAARGGGDAEPGVAVVPPAPAELRRVLALLPVAAGAARDPQRRGAGVELPGGLGEAGADGHEAAAPLEDLRLLEHPVQALREQQRGAVAGGDRCQRLLGCPVAEVIAPLEALDEVERAVRQLDAGGGE